MWARVLSFLSWLGFAGARRRLDDELRSEVAAHLSLLIERYVRSGMTADEARIAAHRQFGNAALVREEVHCMNGVGWIDSLRQDLRHAGRLMLRRRGLTVAVASTLGLGVGVTAAIFSLVYALLLRPLPYPDPEQLVRIHTVLERNPSQRSSLSVAELEAIRTRAKSFDELGAYSMFDTNLAGDGPAQAIKIAWVTPGVLEATGVRPLLGRGIEPADDRIGGTNDQVVLSHHIWRDRFSSDPHILGRRVRMRLLSYTVIGVMPEGYRFPSTADVWAPMQSYLNKFSTPLRLDWNARGFGVVARLRSTTSVESAGAELRALAGQFATERPRSNREISYALTPLRDAEVGALRPYLTLLSVAVIAVLIVACANIAGLLLAQALGRSREFVVRTAIGAGRARVVRQLVTESLALASAGGVVGIAVAVLSTRALVALVPLDMPAWVRIEMNWPVLLFSLALTMLTGVAFGLAPALEASRTDLQAALRPSASGSSRTGSLRKVLIVVEVGLSCVLLVVSGLMLKTFVVLFTSAPGFDPHNLLTAFISPHRVGTTAETTHAYWTIYNRALAGLAKAPGVVAAGGSTSLPYAFEDNELPRARMQIRRPGDNGEPLQLQAWISSVSPNYFAAMGIPLLAGRDFSEGDTIDRECVVAVSARAATRIWGEDRPLGQTAQFGWDSPARPCRVIAVVGNVRYRASEGEDGIEVYWSYRQREAGSFYLVARTAGDPLDYAGALRQAVAAGDRETGVISLKTMASTIGESMWRRRLWGVLLGAFAVLAVALAAIGLYGLLSHSVRRRTREMGIRIALGAQRADAIALVCREATVMIAAGIGVGLAASFFAAKTMALMVFRVQPYDPSIFIGTPLLLAVIATLACVVPARRAAGVDAAVALRHDEP